MSLVDRVTATPPATIIVTETALGVLMFFLGVTGTPGTLSALMAGVGGLSIGMALGMSRHALAAARAKRSGVSPQLSSER